jgi:hypothetical protein
MPTDGNLGTTLSLNIYDDQDTGMKWCRVRMSKERHQGFPFCYSLSDTSLYFVSQLSSLNWFLGVGGLLCWYIRSGDNCPRHPAGSALFAFRSFRFSCRATYVLSGKSLNRRYFVFFFPAPHPPLLAYVLSTDLFLSLLCRYLGTCTYALVPCRTRERTGELR